MGPDGQFARLECAVRGLGNGGGGDIELIENCRELGVQFSVFGWRRCHGGDRLFDVGKIKGNIDRFDIHRAFAVCSRRQILRQIEVRGQAEVVFGRRRSSRIGGGEQRVEFRGKIAGRIHHGGWRLARRGSDRLGDIAVNGGVLGDIAARGGILGDIAGGGGILGDIAGGGDVGFGKLGELGEIRDAQIGGPRQFGLDEFRQRHFDRRSLGGVGRRGLHHGSNHQRRIRNQFGPCMLAGLFRHRHERRRFLHRRRHGFGTGRARRLGHPGLLQNFRREIARPTRMIPTGQIRRYLSLVEHDLIIALVKQVVDVVDIRLGIGIEIDDHHARTGVFELVAIDIRGERLVDDGRTEFLERVAQMPAKLAGLIQQRDGNGCLGFRHDSTSRFLAHCAANRLPDRACRDNVQRRFPARVDDAFRRCAR